MTADRTANAWDWAGHNLAPQRREPAPELTAEQRAIVDRFEAAVEPEEIRVERVARALETSCGDEATWHTLAAAAIAVMDAS